MIEDQVRSVIQRLIERALAGTLPLDELYSVWPEEISSDPLAEVLYDDLESAVEHYPLVQERVLSVDLAILAVEGDSERMLEVRRILIRSDDEPTAENIGRLLATASGHK